MATNEARSHRRKLTLDCLVILSPRRVKLSGHRIRENVFLA